MSGLTMKYFVLKPAGTDAYAAASRRAMQQFAKDIEIENPELAAGLREWVTREWLAAQADDKGNAMTDKEVGELWRGIHRFHPCDGHEGTLHAGKACALIRKLVEASQESGESLPYILDKYGIDPATWQADDKAKTEET